jgi:hypothetical protein
MLMDAFGQIISGCIVNPIMRFYQQSGRVVYNKPEFVESRNRDTGIRFYHKISVSYSMRTIPHLLYSFWDVIQDE